MSDQFTGSPGMPEIIGMFKERRYQEIIPLLKDYLSKNPDDIQARSCLAASYSATGNQVDAIQGFIKLTELQPNVALHYYNLGVAYESMDNTAKAKECYEKALTLSPESPKVQERLKILNAKLGQTSGPAPISDSQLGSWPAGGTSQSQSTPPPAYSQPVGNPIPPRTFASDKPASAPEGLNWGAFFLPFWWSIAHSAWLWMVLSIFFSPIISVVLLITGNKVGWENRKFTGTDQFRSVQKVWAIWGVVLFLLGIVPTYICVKSFITGFSRGFNAARSQMAPMGQMNPMGGQTGPMPGMDMMKIAPGSGTLTSVPVYTGAQQDGGVTSGSDEDGSFSSATYTASANLKEIRGFYDKITHGTGSSSTQWTDTNVDIVIGTKGGLVKIHAEPKGTNQTSITMKTYGQ